MSILENYQKIQSEIKRLQPQKKVIIIPVSKRQPIEKLEEAISSGFRIFGENQIQEALEKFPPFIQKYPEIEVHHIGPVQTGTARKIPGNFSYTHGIGSLNSLKELSKRTKSKKSHLGFFLQVNLTEEDTKSGFTKNELIPLLKTIGEFTHEFFRFTGLMTMGPTSEDPTQTREVFRALADLKENYCPDKKLSMGMSGDYKIAIEEGSDFVRIGSAIFGERIS